MPGTATTASTISRAARTGERNASGAAGGGSLQLLPTAFNCTEPTLHYFEAWVRESCLDAPGLMREIGRCRDELTEAGEGLHEISWLYVVQ